MKNMLATLIFLLVMPTILNSQSAIDTFDEITPFSEGLAAVRIGNQWGFIDEEANLIIDFRDDLVWHKDADPNKTGVLGVSYPQFKNGRCMAQKLKEDDIPYYGFIDKTGDFIIAAEYLNITPFDQEYAIGIFVRKTFQGKNEIKLDVVNYTFTEVLVNTAGEIIWPIAEREHILTSKRRYETPELRAKLISKNLLAIKTKTNTWKTQRLNINL